MSDREKVIGHLYDCLAASKPENLWVFVRKDIVGDALNLLKEQEPIRPILARIGNYEAINDYTCPVCGTDLYHLQKYCDECGRAVKWDD